jgi:hypothetical protein
MAGDGWQAPGAGGGPASGQQSGGQQGPQPGGPQHGTTPPPFSTGPAPGHGSGPTPPSRPVIPLRPLGLGDVLAGAFTVFRRNARVLLLWSLLLSGVLGLASTIATTLGQRSLQERMLSAIDTGTGTGSGAGSDADAIAAGSVTLYLLLAVGVPFLAFLARGFLVAPVAVDTGQRVLGRRGTFRGLWALLEGRRLSVLWWMLLQLAAGAVLGVVVVVVLIGFFGALGATDAAIGGFILALLGLGLVFGLLVAFFTTRFAFTVPTIALEGRGVFSAAAQSWRLTRGAFWRTFGILLLVQVAFSIVAGIASTPLTLGVSLFSGVFDPFGQTGSRSGGLSAGAVVALVLGSLLTIAVQCVTDVLSASVTTFLSIDRRIRTEALDQRIAAHLETGQPADPFAPAQPVAQRPWPQQPQQPWGPPPPPWGPQPPLGQQPQQWGGQQQQPQPWGGQQQPPQQWGGQQQPPQWGPARPDGRG